MLDFLTDPAARALLAQLGLSKQQVQDTIGEARATFKRMVRMEERMEEHAEGVVKLAAASATQLRSDMAALRAEAKVLREDVADLKHAVARAAAPAKPPARRRGG